MCETHRHSGSKKNQTMPSEHEYTGGSGGAAIAELESPPNGKGDEDWRAQAKAEYGDETPVDSQADVVEAEVVDRPQRTDRHSRSTIDAPMPSSTREHPAPKESNAEAATHRAKPQTRISADRQESRKNKRGRKGRKGQGYIPHAEQARSERSAAVERPDEKMISRQETPKVKTDAPKPQAQIETESASASPQSQERPMSKKQRRKAEKARQRAEAAASGVTQGHGEPLRPTGHRAVQVMEILDRAVVEESQHPRNTKGQKKAARVWEIGVMIELRQALSGEKLRPAQFRDAGRPQIMTALETDIRNELGEYVSKQDFPKFMKM